MQVLQFGQGWQGWDIADGAQIENEKSKWGQGGKRGCIFKVSPMEIQITQVRQASQRRDVVDLVLMDIQMLEASQASQWGQVFNAVVSWQIYMSQIRQLGEDRNILDQIESRNEFNY